VEPENESRSRRHQLEVHTQKGTSEVRLQKEQNQVVRDLDKTKNGSVRTVHLNADALGAIESIRRPGQKRTDRVFPREDRKEPTERKQERFDNRSWFETCVTEAGIPRITWHGLRHTFCSWLAMAGATTREIMEAAGHKTMSQAARYSHLSPQHTQSVVDRIAGTGTGQHNMHQNMHHPTKPKDKSRRTARVLQSN
jgi:integrase